MFGSNARLFEQIDQLPVGAALTQLEAADRSDLSGYDRVEVLKARMRLRSHLDALIYADMVAIAQAQTEEIGLAAGSEFAADEISAALAWTRRGADRQLGFAYQLFSLPRVWEALWAGRIDVAKARVIVEGLETVDEETARRVADIVLERASDQTPSQIASRIRRLLMTLDPEAAKKRYSKGVEDRRIEILANACGTANIYGLDLPADRANRIMDRICRIAQTAKVGCDQRNLDQVRADVFMDLLEGKQHQFDEQGKTPVVDLQIDVTTLAGFDDNPGQIPGFGPIIADLARQLAAEQQDGEWRFTVTDPQSGEVVSNGITRRRPTADLKRWVQARRPTCVFPGCRIPARRADLDHTVDYAKGGKTSRHNLAPLCRHHHRAKHIGGWKLRRTQTGGYIWTSPLGHTYTVQPQGP